MRLLDGRADGEEPEVQGRYEWGGVVKEGGMPAIIDEVTFMEAQGIRAARSAARRAGATSPFRQGDLRGLRAQPARRERARAQEREIRGTTAAMTAA